MEVNITCSPAYSVAYCHLGRGEAVTVEPGAMAFMSAGVEVGVGVGAGGVMKSAARKIAGGESFLSASYTAQVDGAWVAVAPQFPGDICVEQMHGEQLLVETGSFLAASSNIDIGVAASGLAVVALREGVTMLKCEGFGELLLGTYGGVQRFDLAAGERMVVDTGHIVGFSASMRPKVGPLGSLTKSVFTGEGLVGVFEGPGLVITQTRSEKGLVNWLMPDRGQNRR